MFLLLLASSGHAQITIDKVNPFDPLKPVARYTQRDSELRQKIASDPQEIVGLIAQKINPFERDKINLTQSVADIVSWSPVAIGCGGRGDIAGYYSPLDHLWVLIEFDENDSVIDAAFANGFTLAGNESAWWPALVDQTGSVLKALQVDTAVQFGIFATIFGGDDCTAISDTTVISQSRVVEQLKMLKNDVPKPDSDRGKLYIDDLQNEMNSDLAEWTMRFQLPVNGDDWFAFFTSPEHIGLLLIAHWRVDRDEGNAHFQNSTLLPLMTK